MLEHDVGTGNSKAESESERALQEVFRDVVVSRQMHDFIEPFTFKAVSFPFASLPSSAPLEVASLPLLGTFVPFYQLYTDFVSLYHSISFSDSLFSRLLLPPMSMIYAADYRKLLWNGYNHVLRGIRVEMGDLVVG